MSTKALYVRKSPRINERLLILRGKTSWSFKKRIFRNQSSLRKTTSADIVFHFIASCLLKIVPQEKYCENEWARITAIGNYGTISFSESVYYLVCFVFNYTIGNCTIIIHDRPFRCKCTTTLRNTASCFRLARNGTGTWNLASCFHIPRPSRPHHFDLYFRIVKLGWHRPTLSSCAV